jgi:hypothetical protein
MAKYNIIFESKEEIFGLVPRAGDWIQYSTILKIKDGGKKPVSMDMTFVPPHPFICNMPETHSIKAESITDAYAKVVKFFKKYGIEFRN